MEIFVVLVFVSVGLLAFTAVNVLFPERRPVTERLVRLARGAPKPVEADADELGLLRPQGDGWLFRLLTPLAGKAAREDAPDDDRLGPIRAKLVQAGFRRPSALPIYMGSRIFLAAATPIVVGLISPAWDMSRMQLVALVCGAAGLGLVIPSFIVDRLRSRRQWEIILGLPDALDLMVVCVEAGLGIHASLSRVAGEFHRSCPILSAEFVLVNLEVSAGKSSTEALRTLAERTGVSEVSSLVAMLVQTERFGTSVADTLRVFADSLRTQRWLRAEEQAGKAPLKMLFPTLIIFMATLIVTLGPGLMQMFDFFGSTE
jgi:tight adherence protein C